jgi:hypothetical protein
MFMLKIMMMTICFYLHSKDSWQIAGDTLTLLHCSNIVESRLIAVLQYHSALVLNLDKSRASWCVSKVFSCQSYKKSRIFVNLVRRNFFQRLPL